MPDQNPVDPAAPGPVTSFSNIGTSTEPPPPAMDSSELPPAPPIVEPAAPETPPVADVGGAAPTFDISTTISGTPPPKKKFGGRRFVATILGLLVLVGGLGAGIILVQQQQDIRERASVTECAFSGDTKDCTVNGCPGKQTCGPNLRFGPCRDIAGDGCPAPQPTEEPEEPTSAPTISCSIISRDPLSQGYCDRSAPNTADCTDKNEGASCTIRSQCGGGSGSCVVINQGGANSECQCQRGAVSLPTQTATVTRTPGGGDVAQCLNVRAFDANWTELTTDQLSQLKTGDVVRFTVAGTTSGGSFDRAKFKINGVERAEVTGKRPGSQEFYDEYTLPAGVTTFTINAQIHHTTLGWSN